MRLTAAPIMPTLPVTDLARAKQFYQEALGLKPVRDTGDGAILAAGDSEVFLYERPPVTSEHTQATFMVDDLVEAMKGLRRNGVTFEEYDLPGLKTKGGIAEVPEGRCAWFEDPDGNILGITEFADRSQFARTSWVRHADEDRNKATVRRGWRALVDNADLDAVDDLYAPAVKYHGPDGELAGIAAVREMIAGYHAAFGEMKVKIEDLVAEGDRVVSRVTITGKHTGEFAGVKPTRRPVTAHGISVMRFRNGKIVEEWESFDMLSLLQQVGAIPN